MLSDSTKTSLIAPGSRRPSQHGASTAAPAAATSEQPPAKVTLAAQLGLACHIVVVDLNEHMRAGVLRCDTLPEGVLTEMQPIMNGWRDWQYKLRDVESVAQAHCVGPIAVWFRSPRHRTLMELPPPVRVTFEPVPLEEEYPGLAPLIGARPAADVDAAGKHGAMASAPRPDAVRIRRPSFARRWLVRTGLLFFAIPLLINGGTQIALHGTSAAAWGLWGGILGITALATAIFVAVSDRWMLAPGSVLIARTTLGGWRLQFQRFVPADSMLGIMPVPLGWNVTLRRGWRGRPYRRMVTDLELCALLAAWRSTEPPPTEQQVRGLGTGGADA